MVGDLALVDSLDTELNRLVALEGAWDSGQSPQGAMAMSGRSGALQAFLRLDTPGLDGCVQCGVVEFVLVGVELGEVGQRLVDRVA